MIQRLKGNRRFKVLVSRTSAAWREISRMAELVASAPLDDFADYDEYWERRGDIAVIHARWRISCAFIPDGASVLDIGCGGGEFLDYLRKRKPNCELTGIDISEKAVERARSKGINALRIDHDWSKLPSKHEYATCLEVLEHVPHAEELLRSIMNNVSVAAIISIPNVGFIGCRIRLALFGRFPTTLCVFHMREHVRFWTTRDFREWIERYGYSISTQKAQHGIGLLSHWFPSLFASGVVYVVKPHPPKTSTV